ncbi:MAG: MiaB/RimO family radical SAM methylthiotransferase [Alphaproteobacteria bacterium]|nr:MiaB/RimO family radical SAM methylthiotransferase [Alphaproteobacteria bacterium]
MQAENTKTDIKSLSFGCRLNALEAEKIQQMLRNITNVAIIVNTCAVTGEAERQCGQAVRRIARENPNAPIFVTGCAATRNPELFAKIPNTYVIHNSKKLQIDAYIDALRATPFAVAQPEIQKFHHTAPVLSKKFIQVQNGCNHKCTYCVTRLLRGPAVSFDYNDILRDATDAVRDGFSEIVLTGVDIASYVRDGRLISDVCHGLLNDAPGIQRLRLSSMDPASPQLYNIIDMIHNDARMMGHLHLSMQSGSDTILKAMLRRHSADMVRRLVASAGDDITFSWDIICGFPGETEDLFTETLRLVRELKPIRIHAFPFSPRPGTVGAEMPNQVNPAISKERVKIITDAANQNLHEFMVRQIGKTVQVLVEENNLARDPHDIVVKIDGCRVAPRTVCDVILTDINGDAFIGKIK